MRKYLYITILVLLASAAATAVFFAAGSWITRKEEPRQNLRPALAPEQKVTIIEGWTLQEIATYLESKQVAKSEEFLEAVAQFDTSPYPLLSDRPAGAGLEGFLFPDTYNLLKNPTKDGWGAESSRELIKKMLDNFFRKFDGKRLEQAGSMGKTLYEIVTLASIIEKETGRNAITAEQKENLKREQGMVAGVFYNRLRVGMPLESDATVNFITKKNLSQPTWEDTRTNNSYNTYLFPGLPPGPISNPSLSAIDAALNPEKTDYFFFLHRQDTGQAIFSKTYQEHLANKRKYLD